MKSAASHEQLENVNLTEKRTERARQFAQVLRRIALRITEHNVAYSHVQIAEV